MAGQPQKVAAFSAIRDHVETVEDLLSAGWTQKAVAAEMQVSESHFAKWLRQPDGAEILARARARAAHAITEDAMAKADALLEAPLIDPETGEPLRDAKGRPRYREPTSNEIQATKLVNDVRFKMAAVWNRQAFGQQHAGINVQVNLGVNALDALRKTQVVEAEPVDVIDVEVRTLDDLL